MIALGRVSKETRGPIILANKYEDFLCAAPGAQEVVRCPGG